MALPQADIAFIGFSCKSASSLNNGRVDLVAALARGDLASAGSTGATLVGLISYLDRHRPLIVILENVTCLLVRTAFGTPMSALQRVFKDLGYELQWALLSSQEYLLPQRRRRIWLWACLSACCRLRDTREVLDVLRAAPLPLSTFLGAEDAEIHAAFKARRPTPRVREFLWKDVHRRYKLRRAISSCPGISSPWFRKLTEREQDALRIFYAKCRLKDGLDLAAVECFIDVSQGLGRMPHGRSVCPCLCPNGRIWSTSLGRLLTGREKMALQGLWCGDAVAELRAFSDRDLSDLAGNAFSTTVCMAVALAVLATLEFV